MHRVDECLLSIRQEIIDVLGTQIGRWQLPNVTGTVQAIAITPDLQTGELYPPPGTKLTGGVEAIVRYVDMKMPYVDSTVWNVFEVVIGTDNSTPDTVNAAIDVLQNSRRYVLNRTRPSTANPGARVIYLRTTREVSD
ncbi:MAG: hypothetical protein ACRC62_29575 [Microcoleus sp.]